ncbi:MAG: AAA family ATPase [Oscillospiraceae bacterium]
MSKTIITISREFGSGGRYIGEQVAKRLGFSYYDKDIIARVAEETGFAPEFIEERGEYASRAGIFAYAFESRDRTGASMADYLYSVQSRIILDITDKGPCVIVGRGSDYILRERPEAMHVFICGDEKAKLERIVRLYNKSESEAAKLMKDTDKKRSINHRYYTDLEWGKAQNYTMSLNSSAVGIERCVDIISELAKKL